MDNKETKIKRTKVTFDVIDEDNTYIKAVVYGASGVGKTRFGATCPNPIFASAEGGLLSIKEHKPQAQKISSMDDLRDLYDKLKNGIHDRKTVVIDSISEINEIIKEDIERKNGRDMQLKDWGTLSKEIRKLLRKFRDLPMHVLMIAQENEQKDGDSVTKRVPSLNGKAATEIAYFMDIVGYMYINKEGDQCMVVSPQQKLLTKDRSGMLNDDLNPEFSKWIDKINNKTK